MFKTAIRLMKLVTEVETQTTLAILARDVYDDLEPGRPSDRFDELPYDDWIALVINKLKWQFGQQFVICGDGHMYIKPDHVAKVVDIAPSFMAPAFINHLAVLRTTATSAYNMAYLEREPSEGEDDLPAYD